MSEVLPEKQEGESDMKKQHHIDLLPGEVAQTVILSPDLEYAAQIAGQLANSKLTARKRQYATYNGEWNGVPIGIPHAHCRGQRGLHPAADRRRMRSRRKK